MELTIKKQLIEKTREEYIIKFKDPIPDSIKITFLPDYALITGGYTALVSLGPNTNPYMRLGEILAGKDMYDYFKSKVIENYRQERYNPKKTQDQIEEYIQYQFIQSIIQDYQSYKKWNNEAWKGYFRNNTDFSYDNQFILVSEVLKFVKDHYIDSLNAQDDIISLLAFSEANYDRYRPIYNILREFYHQTITKKSIQEYYTQLEKQT